MTDFSARIDNLSPEQRVLLERRLRENRSATPDRVGRSALGQLPKALGRTRPMDFTLFFFSADGTKGDGDRYKFLLECCEFADHHGFRAVWTPERHFQDFGGLYPNPSVLSAALAVRTRRVQLRSGSLVLPLHSPVRVAEDWAVVDNLSHGRAAISFATGWHEHDYVIAPEAYEQRRELMFRNIEVVRRLWAGETVELAGPGGQKVPVRTLPRPIQPELPFWVTASSPRTWQRAGEIGANVLTSLIGDVTLDQLEQRISGYRRARVAHGHDPRTGIVSLMLHTYLATDMETAREKVREPLKRYLRSFVGQLRPLSEGALAEDGSHEMEDLLDFAFERYLEHNSLVGTPEKCAAMIDRLSSAGVDEAACLVDFGLDLATTLESLERLDALRHSRRSRRESS